MLLADPERIDEVVELEPEVTEKRTNGAPADVSDEANGTPSSDRPVCTHCKKLLPERNMSVCPHCGYYASLGICIDLDHQWEKFSIAQADAPGPGLAAMSQPKSHLQVWIDLVPSWGWMLLGSNLAILVVSALARLALPSGSIRTMWSVTQLVTGIAAVLTCHIIVYLTAISDDASLSMLDIVLKPFKLWKGTLRALPKTLRIMTASSGGLSAVVGSLLIIGALPYSVLLDWGFKQPPKQNLVGAIVARAQQVGVEDDGNLEDSINDFANQASVDGENEKEKDRKPRADCLIIGYTTMGREPERVTSLVLAREYLGNLIYVGTVTGGFDEELHKHLQQFREIPRKQPFVFIPVAINAQWVQPYYTCRVKYTKEDQGTGRLENLEFDTIIGKVSF